VLFGTHEPLAGGGNASDPGLFGEVLSVEVALVHAVIHVHGLVNRAKHHPLGLRDVCRAHASCPTGHIQYVGLYIQQSLHGLSVLFGEHVMRVELHGQVQRQGEVVQELVAAQAHEATCGAASLSLLEEGRTESVEVKERASSRCDLQALVMSHNLFQCVSNVEDIQSISLVDPPQEYA
jgi:hypothetical protein